MPGRASHDMVLQYWFGTLAGPEDFPQDHAEMWFRKRDTVDQAIRTQFEPTVRAAAAGELDAWRDAPKSCLALVILLDQFSRNIYRGTTRAFEHDSQALEIAQAAIEHGFDRRLYPIEATFMYLPFEHAEDLALQQRCVELFAELAERAAPAIEFPMRRALDYAHQHLRIIEQFGRFPHRNAIFDRTSTPEERIFLEQPGSSF
jgi:uncharacterized protein (DUF924 family)